MATDMCITHVFSSLCPLNLHFVLRVLANLGIKMCFLHLHTEVPPGGSVVKNLPEMQKLQEMQIRSLGQEDPLEEGMATNSTFPSWRIQ